MVRVHAQAYADDQVLIISGSSAREIEGVWLECWDNCIKWASESGLQYNLGKTMAMFVTKKGNVREPVIRMGERKLELKGHIISRDRHRCKVELYRTYEGGQSTDRGSPMQSHRED